MLTNEGMIRFSPIRCVKYLLLVLLIIIRVGCSGSARNDLKIYTVVPPPKPLFDARKYSAVDTTWTHMQLQTRVYQTQNTQERMEIFDYLLTYSPKKADVGEFFKHFDVSETKDLRNSREMDLIIAALNQNEYTAIKEQCINYMIFYQIGQTCLDSVLLWMDSLHILYPTSPLFIQARYNYVSKAMTEITRISADRKLSEPERLWWLGYSYWRLASAEFKSPFHPFLMKTRLYFDSLRYQYPKSPFIANAEFIDNIDLGDEGDDLDTSFDPTNVNRLMDLLKKYPRTTARDEILLIFAGYHYSKAQWMVRKNQDSAFYFLCKTDSIIDEVNPSNLFMEYSSHGYHNIIAGIGRMLKELGKTDHGTR